MLDQLIVSPSVREVQRVLGLREWNAFDVAVHEQDVYAKVVPKCEETTPASSSIRAPRRHVGARIKSQIYWRAGALSAIATLWHVNDPASYELIVEFYRQLRAPHISRAAALRTAQLKMLDDLRYDHPGYWAPFLLINNWL